jgi:hypothetical protein
MKYSTNHLLVAAALLLLSPASLSGFQFATTPLIVRNQHNNVLATSHDIRSKNVVSLSFQQSGPKASTTRLQMSDVVASETPNEEENKGFLGKVCYCCPLILFVRLRDSD